MKTVTIKTIPALLLVFVVAATAAHAQTMPAPRRMPRTPVSSQTLEERTTPPRILQGPAAIIDGEKLRLADTDLRLFGIVPPQLAASFGPQARAALDALANGQNVTCQIRDRDRDGRLLATCRNTNGADMALELLRRGLAVTARGSLAGTDLAAPYLTAEQAAQNQKIGLWSVGVPAPAAVSAAAAPAASAVALPAPVTPRSDKAAAVEAPPPTETQAKVAADVMNAQARTESVADDDRGPASTGTIGFFERYQILIAGFLMLATWISIVGVLWAQKSRDKRDETKAVAAALRGELMGARGVCAGRIKSITNEIEDRAATWPRIRSTLYQAYVGRLGFLGAELARQVASIYGQSSDYASLYSPTGTAHDSTKKHALETLVRHIDEILPRLAHIEQTGLVSPPLAQGTLYPPPPPRPRSPYDGPAPRATHTPPVYRNLDAPQERRSEPRSVSASASESGASSRYFDTLAKEPAGLPSRAPTPPTPMPVALYEAVRGFLQRHRNAIEQQAPEEEQTPLPSEEHVNEYAAMIEADMARYSYSENIEPFNYPPQKKSG